MENPERSIGTEFTRQFIIAAFAIAVIVVEQQIRPWPGSDNKETKMSLALAGERFCQKQAERFATWADKCKRIYDRERL